MNRLYGEYQKVWFVRSSRIYLVFAGITSILIGLAFSLTTKITQGRTLSQLEPMEIISVNMLGVDVWTLFLIIFIAVQIGREFQERTIQSYLMAVPSRNRYFWGKMLFFFLIALVFGVLVAFVTRINGQILLSYVKKPLPDSRMLWQFTAGCLVMPLFYSALTVCSAIFTNSTAGGIVIPTFVLFLPILIRPFPDMLQSAILPLLPASAIHTLSGTVEKGSAEYTGMTAALLMLNLWFLLFAIAAVRRFGKKDI